ncbi:unnamed protein product [Dovyalis caffra]|uniref:MATH domain-containing protein n=1 Tax=Dovyalis caffra TaxID=77055 RepID=A0AAV1SBL6_9ROSI|nr:unnamed protein product [Dovyalis caffra]
MKTEWGFHQWLSLETFNDASNGYLVDDCYVFGAKLFVIKPTGKWELVSMVKKAANASLTWKIEDFSELDKSFYFSKAFTVGERMSFWMTSSGHTLGFHKFMPLGDLHEVSKGYIMNDTLIVEVEILTLSVSK